MFHLYIDVINDINKSMTKTLVVLFVTKEMFSLCISKEKSLLISSDHEVDKKNEHA